MEQRDLVDFEEASHSQDRTAAKPNPFSRAGREFDDDLIEQLNVLPQFVAACGFTNVKDDFLAAAVAFEERACGFALVASGDRDSFQLASDRITILYPSRGGQLTRVRPEEVRQRYGVDPQPVPDFIALRGDPRINCLDPWGLDQYAPLNWGGDTEAMIHPSTRGRRVAVVDYSEA